MFSDRRKRDMANHGEGNKYASVNLNKSYGYQPHHQYNQSGGYGANRGRGGGYGGGGGGGSMVVLSRPRSSQNAGPKLSVPPPLNLPSLRKEHERVDSSNSSFHAGGGISGSGTRPASSGMGWSKPAATAALQDGDISSHTVEGGIRGSNGMNMPLDARAGAAEPLERAFHPVQRAATLRGEDFPSLKATLPSASASGHKQKEGVNQKQKQAAGEELPKELRGVSGMSSSLVDMRPQNQSERSRLSNELSESPNFQDGLHSSEQVRKKEYLSGPLPLVRVTPRSDWADDERDTSHGLRDRDRDYGYSKNEPYWDRSFDLPRSHVLPQKHAAPSHFDKPGQRENEIAKTSLAHVRPVSGGRETNAWRVGGGREANAWRVSSPLQNEVANNNKNSFGARPSSRGRDVDRKSNYALSAPRENVWNNSGAREAPYQHGGRQQPWNNNMDSFSNRGNFTRDGYGTEHQNRDRRPFFKSDKPHVEDPFMQDFGDSVFDVHDPFPVLGVAKKKKEALKQTEFHDPVRESFEAELERVQKMQEEERRRVIEEQERVMELARTEEEERLRLAHEQDERQRRLEEEAREAAFRNEQERVEAARRAEELRKSKEEEKQKLLMEEERRKQAAKQKLLELEERISRRQAEAAKGCSSSSIVSEDKFLENVKEREFPTAADVDWEDSEKMVDRITMSSTLDLSVPRSSESNVVSQFSRDGSFGFPDRQKPTWRKEDIESGSNSRFIPQNIENVPHSPQRDAGGVFPKEEFFGTTGYLSSTSYFKPGFPENSVDQSWRIPGDGRNYGRNYGVESESREGFGEQYGDPGWGQNQGRVRRGPYTPYPEKLYQNPEEDDYYPFGRPRYSVRQPRVLPPPQASRQKSSFRSEVEHPGPSTVVGGMKYSHTGRTASTVLASYTEDLHDHHVPPSNGRDEHQFDSKLTGRCDSQSSLSVSSPPDSPVHLSHDDLDESGDSSVLAGSRKGEDADLLVKEGATIISSDAGKDSLMIATGSVSCWDNEEWTLDSNERVQEQEVYDEDEDGYQEEDKIHGVDENMDLAQELEDMHLQDKDSNLVLGFNEGVEVEIPSDDFEKCQQNLETAFPRPQHTVDFVDGKGPSIATSCAEQSVQCVEISDPVGMHNTSTNFRETQTTIQKLTSQPNNGRQSFEVADKVDSASNSTVSTHPVVPPFSIGLHPSPLQTAMAPVSSTAAQMEQPVKVQFGLFSGPSLIPSPFPAIQIGSIQMPLPLHPQFGSSLTHIQQHQPPVIQFGQLQYAPQITQGVLPLPPHSVVQANALSTYALNQSSESLATGQLSQGNPANPHARNASNCVPNPQVSVLRRPIDVSGGSTLKNAMSPAKASTEATVPPQKQAEWSGKSELPSRKMSHGKSNFAERQSVYQVHTDTTAGRNSGLRSSGNAEVSRTDSGGYRRYRRQRVEFRVRESNWPSSEENRNANGRAHNSTRNGNRKYVVSNKSHKQTSDSSVSGLSLMQKTNTGGQFESRTGKDAGVKNQTIPNSGQANLKRNLISEKEIDAPLQSGIVRIFEQHGIEAPSDDDDFIEVRSKRQMLNDRREQREKEIKEKSQATKASRKPRSTLQNSAATSRSNKSPPATRIVNNNKQFNPVSSKQPLAPIGTPAPKTDSQADKKSGSSKPIQASTARPGLSKNDQNPASSFIFSDKNKGLDNIQTSVGTWDNPLRDQPVMALTQSQLDEAMKPVSFHSCPVENVANSISEPNPTSTSVLPKNNTFPIGTTPIKSLLAEGKIQFGAVTSSAVPPQSGRSESDSSLYFEKVKHIDPSSTGVEICEAEAEAEAAASAIAVAAITSDEMSVNALGPGSVLPVETKIYRGTEIDDEAESGTVAGQPSLSKAEESLSVSLPADLSVDTPIPMWPPPSPHNSNQMITHFPPGPPHFPFYDMNPMLRGPIFAFGPHNESGPNQSQSQKGPGSVSGPPSTWQQGHSTVDSFYAPPAGFTGPFLTPPGAIPGVQGPPHMFVYNHFAPVGQFGQVGLSFMGTTYIPSGKQPDWKHTPVASSGPVGGDGDAKNSNVASMQCNIVPASVQHLPMPSPLAMFDPSPFQASHEMPIRGRWPYMPSSALHPLPPTIAIQKQQEPDGSIHHSQFNNMLPPPNRYPNVQTSPAVSDGMVAMAESSSSYSSTVAGPSKATLADPSSKPTGNTQNTTGSSFKPLSPLQPQSSQQKNSSSQHVSGPSHHQNHQHNRRSSFHGRNQPMNRDKSFQNNTKVKQIYVAKQTCTSNASTSASTSVSTTTTSPSI